MQIITHFRNVQFRCLPIQSAFEIMSIVSWSGHETEAMCYQLDNCGKKILKNERVEKEY